MAKQKLKKSASLTGAVSKELKKNFSLELFKNKKGLVSNTLFKPQEWIPLSPALMEVLSIPGIPKGHIVTLRGHTDTGKTTAMIEAAVAVQKQGGLPVFIITEMKWNWEYVMKMGFEVELIKDETGKVIDYQGNFIYIDREAVNSVEDVASFILDLLDEQKSGNLPYELTFLWDSVGSIPCEMSIKSQKNNNEWNAGAMSTQFGNNINQMITLSRKDGRPYTNTLVIVNKVWVAKPAMPMGQPKLMNKGGFTMWFDSTFVITFGNIANSGTSKIKAINGGKQVEFAKRTNVQIDKNHVNGVSTRGRLIMTAHGFIKDTPNSLKKYKEAHKDEWADVFEGKDFTLEIEEIIDERSSIPIDIGHTKEPD